jgi:repressor LexA
VPAEEHVDGYLPVPAEWTTAGNHFAVRVDGTSMEGAGILDGDIAIARQQAVATPGDVVVATVDGKTTLKRFTRTAAGVTLAAENPHHRAIPVRIEDARVQGVVVGLLRAYRQASAAQWTEKRVRERPRGRR